MSLQRVVEGCHNVNAKECATDTVTKFRGLVSMDTIGEEGDETILACDDPSRNGAQAMSFPNAPTMSILIICCGNG